MTASLYPREENLRQFPEVDSVAVRLEDVWHRYHSNLDFALQGISLEIARQTSTVILGPSGSGKTTLLKMINGLLRPTQGRVTILGSEVNDRSLRGPLRGRVGYIPQQLGLIRHRTALENALLGALPRMSVLASLLNAFHEGDIRLAQEALSLVGLGHKASEKVYRLSGGERRRVAIARTLVQKPDVILADEFVSDLDEKTAREVLQAMLGLQEKGITLIMALHDTNLAKDYAERAIMLFKGRKVAEMEAGGLKLAEARKVVPSLQSS